MSNEVRYFKDSKNNRMVKLDFFSFRAYYLNTEHQWVRDNDIFSDILHSNIPDQYQETRDFQDEYPIKNTIQYEYYKDNCGIIFKVDSMHNLCYTLGKDLKWHWNWQMLMDYEHAEVCCRPIAIADRYPVGEAIRRPIR